MGRSKTTWKPGQCGNLKGGPKLDPVLKEVRALDKKELTLVFSNYLRLGKEKLREAISKPEIPVKDLIIAKAISMALETGDFRYVQPYVEYIFGKPIQESVEMKFVLDFSGKLTDILNRTMPDACPHCHKELTLRENTLIQLEALSKNVEMERNYVEQY